jgi:membrane protease YdiL (CAAX protease family)
MANVIAVSIRTRPAVWFVPLAFLLSWYPAILGGLGVKASGINPLGPLVAALVVSGISGGWPAIRALLGRLVLARVRLGWYLVALLLAPALAFAALGVGLLSGLKTAASGVGGHTSDLISTFLVMFFFVGLGEEPGWRGFLLPALQRTRSALESALIVGVIWALWHAPFYGNQVPWAQTAPFFLNVVAGSVVIAWVFNNARQSLFLCILMHAVNNTVGGALVGQLLTGNDLTSWWWIFTVLWWLAAALIVWYAGPSLQR